MGVYLIILSILCYVGQSFFNKMYSISYRGPEAAATPVFAMIYGFLTAIITFFYNKRTYAPDSATLILGIANGLVLFLFNLGCVNASRTGPYAFQSLMSPFGSILLLLLFSVLFLGEKLAAIKIAGICLMLFSFLVFNAGGMRFDNVKKGYFFWIALLFVSNGIYGILLDAQQRLSGQNARNEMIITTFAVSGIISLIYLLIVQGNRLPQAFSMEKKTLLFAFASSTCAAAAVNMLMISLQVVTASVLFTVENGAILVLCALLSAVVLKEKITRCMVAGICIAVISLVLLSV